MSSKPHFVLTPLMCPGHYIPMIDMAKFLAEQNTFVTIILTPLVAQRMKPITDRAINSGLPIQILLLSFPTLEAGLPDGCETIDTVPSMSLFKNLFHALELLQQPYEQLIQNLNPKPNCIIVDKHLAFSAQTADKFNIPRIVFDGMNCFTLVCFHSLHISKVYESVGEDDPFIVPGLPDKIQLTRSQLPGIFNPNPGQISEKELRERIRQGEENAYGVVINSFEELEPKYVKELKKIRGDNVWCIGPLSLCNNNDRDKAERGNISSINENQCLNWLDKQKPSSVIYACLGSLNRLTPPQLIELGLGLDSSTRPFIWVIRGANKPEEVENWIKENKFEERVKDKAIVVRGWAPQVLILSHPAVGAFLTHCGWNSSIEGISSGLPMICWPLFGEQFLNENLIVDVLGIGYRVGTKGVTHIGDEEKYGVTVSRERVADEIRKVMSEDEEGKEMRKRVRELGKMAKMAIGKGGSSYLNLITLVNKLRNC
ncbi:UDP-glycosyltransferase 73C4-like [Impatiens glandulifera]|uniref:UDP-glycosyltransferase 73C4-like n=1 Tax=Impatiens glandulifera TaxID=253017 RepID=UPI001FB06832|nr:UDP-glycosyltransferase 73C4-like [Impatiens glandulifera]